MALLPNTPFTDIEDFRVAVDAPVSTDLMTDIVVDLNYLESILRDGAAAIAGIITNTINIEGAGTALQVDNDVNIDGTLTVGNFVVDETPLVYSNIGT